MSARDNENQSVIFVVSGGTPMTLTRNVPVVDNDEHEAYCPDCIEEDGISMVDNYSTSWIGHAVKTIHRIIDDLRMRAPRATVTLVTLLGGIETQMQSVSIQCEEQIDICLSSVELMMTGSRNSATINLYEHLTKMNPAPILKKSTPRQEVTQFDQMYFFLCEDDLSSRELNIKATVSLAPLVRWFMLGDRLRSNIASIKRRFAPPEGDFEVFTSEDTIAQNLVNRLLPSPEEKPVLAFGAKTAKFVISPSSGVRSVEVLGFMPVGNVSTSNLSQFSYDEEFIYEIGQDPDCDETPLIKKRCDIERDYMGTLPDAEQQLLPLLLNGMIHEHAAAFCQVALKENSEYRMVRRALSSLQDSSTGFAEDESVMEMDQEKTGVKMRKGKERKETESDLPVYGVLFATKNGVCYETPLAEEVQELVSDEGPSDDDDIDDVIEEEQGKVVRLTLALISPLMDRPGWPEMQQWTTELKDFNPQEKLKLWETDKYENKNNRWLDDGIFTRQVAGTLVKLAAKKDFAKMKKELSDLEYSLKVRSIDVRSINDILDIITAEIADPAIVERIRAMKK